MATGALGEGGGGKEKERPKEGGANHEVGRE